MSTPMDTSDGVAAASATPAAASNSTLAPPAAAPTAASSSPAPAPSPQPTAADEEAEDELINDDAKFDEDDLMDDTKKPTRKANAAGAAAAAAMAPSDALERLNELLKRTEQFAKFVPGAAAPSKKKGRGRHGANGGSERLAEEEEDAELVKDEVEQTEAKSWPDHLDEQPTSVVKAGGLPMRGYQLEALNWLIKLHDQNLNGVLADEMGLGKTLESLSLLAYLKQYRKYGGPHLILVPKSTSSNWMREVNRWTNNLLPFKFHGNQEERDGMKLKVAEMIADEESGKQEKGTVIVTTYEMVIREKSFFGKIKWKYLYIDEAHRIKNENSLLSRVVRTFHTEHRLLITGTPLQNNLHELWALLNFLVPSLFHSSEDFAEWFNLEGNDQRADIVQRLHRLLRPFLLRRLKSDVEKALLPKIESCLLFSNRVALADGRQVAVEELVSTDLLAGQDGRVVRITTLDKTKVSSFAYQIKAGGASYTVTPGHLVTVSWRMGMREPRICQAPGMRHEHVQIFYADRATVKMKSIKVRFLRPGQTQPERERAAGVIWSSQTIARQVAAQFADGVREPAYPLVSMDDFGLKGDEDLLQWARDLRNHLTTIDLGDLVDVPVEQLVKREGELWNRVSPTTGAVSHQIMARFSSVPAVARVGPPQGQSGNTGVDAFAKAAEYDEAGWEQRAGLVAPIASIEALPTGGSYPYVLLNVESTTPQDEEVDRRYVLANGIVTHNCLYVSMSAMQKAWYKKILERDIEVLNATNTSKVRLLNIVMQLRKVCIDGETPVTLASGVAVPLKHFAKMTTARVMAYSAAQQGVVPAAASAFVPSGPQECIELLFADGRTLTCTPTHELLTVGGKWVEARAVALQKLSVLTGLEGPIVDPMEDGHALARARLLGYYCGAHRSMAFRTRVDAEACAADVQIVCGVDAPIRCVDTRYTLTLPSTLAASFTGLLSATPATAVPSFLLSPSCSLATVREFLAAWFGAAATVHEDARIHTVGASAIQQLLARFDDCAGVLLPSKSFTAAFGQRIGFRYNSQQQMRLTTVLAHQRLAERGEVQQQSVMERAQTLVATGEAVDFAAAIEAAMVELSQQQLLLPAESMAPSFHAKADVGASSLPTVAVGCLGARPVGLRDVFDITVPGHASFVAGSVLVHNCNHPYLFQGAEPGPPYLEGEHIVQNSSKMVLLDKLLKKLEADGHRVLIFSQMTRILDILEDYTRYRGYAYCRIDGQTKQEERDEAMEQFNAPNSKKFVFLLSTRAGGLGINLQTADTVILFDSDWNPQMDLQAMDRAHRIGQKKQVTVFRFVVEHSIEQKMVERATAKLFLDALVIKQGRLNEADKSVSAQELQDMVRFGASRIFQGADAETITDEDIDIILARGSEMTKLQTEKMKQNAGNDLLNFSMTDEAKTNFQMFEGKDYTGFRASTGFDFIEPAKRERKGNYDINAYYRDALKATDGKKSKSTKEWRPTQRFDFQFFDEERLNVLEKKDFESKVILQRMKNDKKAKEREERRIREEREKDERRKARYAKMRADRLAAQALGQTLPDAKEEDLDSDDEGAPATSASAATPAATPAAADQSTKMEIDGEAPVKGEAPAAAAAAASSDAAATSVKVESADGDVVMKAEDATSVDAAAAAGRKSGRAATKVSPAPSPMPASGAGEDEEETEEDAEIEAQMRELAGCLTQAEETEMKTLQAAGFGNWSRRHIISMTKAMEKFGRKDLPNIRLNVEEKTPAEVDEYYPVFWARHKELKNWDQIVKQVERGEARLRKQEEHQRTLDEKVRRYRGNFEKMTIPYPNNSQKTFTEEEDKFLIIQMHRLGFGAWEDLKSCIRSSWMFRFDWFIKSRTCGELSKRVEYLLKLLEKEQEAWAEEKKEAEKQRRAKVLKAAQQAMASSAAIAAASGTGAAAAAAGPSPTKKKKESGEKAEKASEKAGESTKKKKEHAGEDGSTKKKKKEHKEEKKEKKEHKKEKKEHKKEKSEKKESKKRKEVEGDAASSSKKKKEGEAKKPKTE